MPTADEVAALVDEHADLAALVANRWSRVYPHLRHDLLSAAGWALWKAAQSWRADGGASFETWANVVIRWRLVRVVKQAPPPAVQSDRPDEDGEILDGLASKGPTPDEVVELREDLARLPELLDVLDERRRDWLVRNVGHGVTTTEIAGEAGCSRQNVEGQVERALKQLQEVATGETP